MVHFVEPRPTGYWAQVGENGRLFEGAEPYGSALAWYKSEMEFQNPGLSLDRCVNSASRFHVLIEKVADDFPLIGEDYKFVIDENRDCLGVLFGSMLVTESDFGFNVEMVTNWLTKHRETVCSGLPLDATAALLRCSSGSRSFSDIDPRPLHLSDANREILSIVCRMK